VCDPNCSIFFRLNGSHQLIVLLNNAGYYQMIQIKLPHKVGLVFEPLSPIPMPFQPFSLVSCSKINTISTTSANK
jgi:hypothetical protein